MPDVLITLEIIALLALLSMSAFFSLSETALISSNKLRIRKLGEEGMESALVVQRLMEHPNRLLATILVGNNIVNISAAAIATSLAINFFGSKGVGIAIGVFTFVILVFGEITPKSLAFQKAERISLLVAKPLDFLVNILYPLVRALTFITKIILKPFGGDVKRLSPYVTEEEIKMLVEVGEREGTIEKREMEMIHSIFEFTDKVAREAMIPRVDMDCVDVNLDLNKALNIVLRTRHRRMPVYEGSIDNIIGIVNAHDLLHYLKEQKGANLRDIARSAYYVPETKKLGELFREMQEKKTQIAIVVDEYGGTAGLITLENLLEEIVGEILDEYDAEEPPIEILDEHRVLVDAKTSIKELNEAVGLNLPEEDFETIGGLVFNKFGRIPSAGEKIRIKNITIAVEKMRGRRISKLKITKPRSSEAQRN